MIDPRILTEARERGVLTDDQCRALETIAADLVPRTVAGATAPMPDRAAAGPRDPENLRFVGGFGDIFVTIGLLLFVGAASYLVASAFGTTMSQSNLEALTSFFSAALVWGLAEIFTLRRRMALPSIVLLGLFVFAVLQGFAALLATTMLSIDGLAMRGPSVLWRENAGLALAMTAGAAGLYYWRFRVPIAVAAGAAALVALSLSLLGLAAPNFVEDNLRWLTLVAGIAVFALAMRFDLSDPMRITRRTDIAFWLHLLAAPLVVHPLLSVWIGTGSDLAVGDAILVLAVFVALGLVAIAIDRRAMLVAGLVSAGFALRLLFEQGGFGEVVSMTFLALGAFILLLSVGWRPLRRLTLSGFPRSVAARLAPIRTEP